MSSPSAEHPLMMLDAPASRSSEYGDAIRRMVEGTLAGILVRGVVDPEMAAAFVAQLRRIGESLPTFRPPVFKGYVLGKPLVSAANGLPPYLDDAAALRAKLRSENTEAPAIEDRVHAVLSTLAQGYDVSVPMAADGRSYLSSTVRILIEGDRLPLHYENETLRSPVMNALRPQLNLGALLSYYMPLAVPPAGGQLRLFHTSCLAGGDTLVERFGGEESARPKFEERGFSYVTPRLGDLLVFDGGRWYHDVTPIQGGERWTLGGFLAATKDAKRILYWS